MWQAACEYFEWCEDNPFMETEAKVLSGERGTGSTIEMAELPKMRPFTMHGLCLYLNCNTAYFRQFKVNCSEDFSTIINQIEEVIYNQKFSGAASGFLNANLISRDLGLVDKKEVQADITGKQTFEIAGKKIEF